MHVTGDGVDVLAGSSALRDRDAEALGAVLLPDGALERNGRQVPLSIRERQCVGRLLDRAPATMPVAELDRLLWSSTRPSDRARRTTLMALRRKLGDVGLALRCRVDGSYSIEVSRWQPDALTDCPR